MSRVTKRNTTRERVRKQEKRDSKKSTSSPCGRKPAQIDAGDIVITSIASDDSRHAHYRLRVEWPEVTEDIDGFPVSTIDRYIVHLQHSDDGVTWDPDYRRKVVDAKDGDDNTTAKAIFKGIRRKRYYRVRVRARDRKGCRSELSDWSDPVRPGAVATVVGVGSITRTRVGPRRIEFDWDDVTDPDFDRYKVVILKADSSGGSFSVVRTRYVRHSYIAVHVSDTDKTKWWKVRVRAQLTLNPDGTRDESADTDSDADQADDSTVAAGDTGRQVRVFTKIGLVRKREYEAKWTADRRYKLIRVRAFVGKHDPDLHPDSDGCPRGSSVKVQLRKYDADYDDDIGGVTNLFDSDAKMEILANKHRDSAWIEEDDPDYNWTTIDADESIAVKVTTVGSEYPGRYLRINLILEPY